MALTPEVKKEIIAQYGSTPTDTGSPEAQVALLSKRIDQITDHLKANPHDHHNRRGLLLLVGRRRRILQYEDRYQPLPRNYREARYSPLIK
jgi:small subunit ribosomal protein S15